MEVSREVYWSGLPCPPPGIFLTQGSNPCFLQLLHCRQILYCWATREAPSSLPQGWGRVIMETSIWWRARTFNSTSMISGEARGSGSWVNASGQFFFLSNHAYCNDASIRTLTDRVWKPLGWVETQDERQVESMGLLPHALSYPFLPSDFFWVISLYKNQYIVRTMSLWVLWIDLVN